MNIYGSLMDIYDPPKKHLCRNIDSCASPTPKGVYLWTFKKIIHEHLWLIDGHF